MREAGGEVYAISSEPQQLSSRAQTEWKLDFESVGDPHHEIAEACRERGWLDLFVNPELEFLQKSSEGVRDFTPTHPKGFFQPGVLVLSAESRVLYRWRGVPSRKNMGGAVARPTASHVWTQLEATLDEGASGTEAEDAALDADPTLDMKGVPWPLFASLLIANGWFVDGRGFRGPEMIKQAMFRLVGFVAAWIAAFVWLPTLPVLLALGAWAGFITPRVQWLGRQFQNVDVDTA